MSDQETELLKLAFTHHLSHEAVDADGRVDPSEAAFLGTRFPRSRLVEFGFVDQDGAYTEVSID